MQPLRDFFMSRLPSSPCSPNLERHMRTALKKRGVLLLKVLLCSVFLLIFPIAAFANESVLTILYTGAMRGELEPCGCSPENLSGGLARLSGFISANQEKLRPYVLVDAGNSLGDDSRQGRLKSDAVVRSFSLIGYDAAAFSKDKTSPDALKSAKKHGLKPVGDAPGGKRSVRAKKGKFSINISSDKDASRKGMLNVLLTDRPAAELGPVDGWDVVVTSSGETLEEPLISGRALVVSGYPRGQKLGMLTLSFDDKGRVSGYSHQWQALGNDIKENPNVREIINEYDKKVAELVRDEDMPQTDLSPYLGAESCVECHRMYNDGWKDTRHAGAFGTLERAGKPRDPECVNCHSTGYGEEGGFYSITATPGLAGVQCESCHGPGREHAKDFGPMRPVTESVCVKCHTDERSPGFEFNRYLEKIVH